MRSAASDAISRRFGGAPPLYTREDTIGALLRDVAASRLDLAVTFCAPQPPPPGVTLWPLVNEPAIVRLPDSHPLAARAQLALSDLADETILVRPARVRPARRCEPSQMPPRR